MEVVSDLGEGNFGGEHELEASLQVVKKRVGGLKLRQQELVAHFRSLKDKVEALLFAIFGDRSREGVFFFFKNKGNSGMFEAEGKVKGERG